MTPSFILSRSTNPDVYNGQEHFVVLSHPETGSGAVIADIEGGISAEAEVTAAFIVRACNSHASLVEECKEFREAVLNERHQLAEGGFCSDQINAVLGLFDDTIGNVIAKAEPSSPSHL